MAVGACFSQVFEKVKDGSNEEYTVILYKGTTLAGKANASNACLFTKKEIKQHLLQAQELYPFKFSIRENKDWKGYEVFIVTLKINNVPGIFHKYILTWLRYMYEFPYNVILLDAHRLKKERRFRFSSMSDMFNIVLSHYCREPMDIHQIALNATSERLRKSDIREKIKKVDRLNRIYKKLKDKGERIPTEIGNFAYTDIEYWDEQKFEEVRKPIYMSNLKDNKK